MIHLDTQASTKNSHVLYDLLRFLNWCVMSKSAVQDPVLLIGLIVTAFSFALSYPQSSVLPAIPLVVSYFLIVFMPSGVGGLKEMKYGKLGEWFYLILPSRHNTFLPLLLFLPTALGILRVMPGFVALHLTLSALVASIPCRLSSHEDKSCTLYSSRSQLTIISYGTTCFCLLYLWAWPYIASHYPPQPGLLPSLVAIIDNAWQILYYCLGAVPQHIDATDQYYTRGDGMALASGTEISKTFLLPPDSTLYFSSTLLLICTVAYSMVFRSGGRTVSTSLDFLSVSLAFIFSNWSLYRDARLGRYEDDFWQYRFVGTLSLILTWYMIRIVTQAIFSSTNKLTAPKSTVLIAAPKRGLASSVVAGALICLAALYLWQDPGRLKVGRIMIDEQHSTWERSDRPMTTETYGIDTVYNYSYMLELFRRHSYVVEINKGVLNSNRLSNVDVLILKTPTSPYSNEEVLAVKRFVEKGGGLWLIGDHTNIFGMNTYLNQIGSQWGIRFNADAVSPLPHYYQQITRIPGVPPYHKCGNRAHEVLCSKPYLNHPIVGSDINYCQLLTSCSVDAPIWCQHVSVSRGTFLDAARFGHNTFFGDLKHNADERYDMILQNVALECGAGRVATWSDSTLFSNFSICLPGVPNICLNSVGWLNRTNLVPLYVRRGISLAISAIMILAIIYSHRDIGGLLACTLQAFLICCLLIPVIDSINKVAYQPMSPEKNFHTVVFDQQYSHLELPAKTHVHPGDPRVFETFYVMVQRLGMMPVTGDRLSTSPNCSLIVFANLDRELSRSDLTVVKELLVRGGSVLVLVGGKDALTTCDHHVAVSNAFLQALDADGRFVVLEKPTTTELYGPLIKDVIISRATVRAAIFGNNINSKLGTAEGDCVLAYETIGRGRLLLCSIADLCSNASLGEPGTTPSETQAVCIRASLNILNEALQILPSKLAE